MLKLIALALALTASPLKAETWNYQSTLSELANHDTFPQIARDTDTTVNGIVRLGVWKLRKLGHNQQADEIEAKQKQFGVTYFQDRASSDTMGDIGDHDPYSVWLSVVYEVFLYYIGEQGCEFLHLDDINIVNFAIPVVFNPKIAFDMTDYSQHWNPFWGVVAYWTIWVGCEVGTMGTGWFLICTPAGKTGEFATKNWIAPPLGRRIYTRWKDNHNSLKGLKHEKISCLHLDGLGTWGAGCDRARL